MIMMIQNINFNHTRTSITLKNILSIANLFFYVVDNKIKYGKVMNTRK